MTPGELTHLTQRTAFEHLGILCPDLLDDVRARVAAGACLSLIGAELRAKFPHNGELARLAHAAAKHLVWLNQHIARS